jgi:hypothetical protein
MWKELLGNDPLTKDQLAAINESNAPSLANFCYYAKLVCFEAS